MCTIIKHIQFRRFTSATSQSKCFSVAEQYLDSYAVGCKEDRLNTADSLARYLAKCIVAFGEHFIVLEKPPNLSVWGHSLSKEQMFTDNLGKVCGRLSVKDCLPNLLAILADEQNFWPAGDWPLAPGSGPKPSALACSAIARHPDELSAWKRPDQLHIVCPLSAIYSGLILLATTQQYAQLAGHFYRVAARNQFPGSVYQTFMVACWGDPFRDYAEVSTFPIASHKATDSISIGFKPGLDMISGSSKRRGKLLQKQIGHRVLARGSQPGCLLSVMANSHYLGLPEVYLLHEGLEVIGEALHSSRLLPSKQGALVLPPTSAHLNPRLPAGLAAALGNVGLKRSQLPVHIHRSQLLLPVPLSKSPSHVLRTTSRKPIGRIFNLSEDPLDTTPLISWQEFKSGKKLSSIFYLNVASPRLPSYFSYTLQRFGIKSPI